VWASDLSVRLSVRLSVCLSRCNTVFNQALTGYPVDGLADGCVCVAGCPAGRLLCTAALCWLAGWLARRDFSTRARAPRRLSRRCREVFEVDTGMGGLLVNSRPAPRWSTARVSNLSRHVMMPVWAPACSCAGPVVFTMCMYMCTCVRETVRCGGTYARGARPTHDCLGA
jgi:hypothetical protein